MKLAVYVFCKSTRDALQFYASNEGKSSWTSTADFLTLILKLWNVLNVKNETKEKRKRDCRMDPIRSSMELLPGNVWHSCFTENLSLIHI